MAAPAYSFLRVMVQTRARGHHALAATAYRFALNVTADDGREWHYARRGGVAASGSALPEGAARRWADPILWASEIEAAERRKDSRLMRDDVLGIPVALVAAGKAYEVVAEYAQRISRLRRTPVHFALHPPPRGDSSNWHVHVIYAGRQLTADGQSFARKRDRSQDRAELIDQHKAIWSEVCAEYGVELDFSGPVSEQPLAHLGPQAAGIERMAARCETVERLAAGIRETGGQVDDLHELASAAQAAHGGETISELLARDRAPVTTAARRALRPKPSRRAVHEHACTQLGAWTPPGLDSDDFPEPVRSRPQAVEVVVAPLHRPRVLEVVVAPPHRPRVPEVVVAPPHRPRVPEVVVAPLHRPRVLEVVVAPLHRPRVLEVVVAPPHRPRVLEVVVAPPHRPRVPEVVVAPLHRPRVPEVVVAPLHRPRVLEVVVAPLHRPRVLEVVVAPLHRPRVPEVVVAPPHRPRALEVVVAPPHRPRVLEVVVAPALHTRKERERVIQYLQGGIGAGGMRRPSLSKKLDRLARARLADMWPCDFEVMQRDLTPETHHYYHGADSPAIRSKAPFVSPQSAPIAAKALWEEVCRIARRRYGGRTSPAPEDEWPGLRARTRVENRKKAIDHALEEWRMRSSAVTASITAAVLQGEIERWREFDQERRDQESRKFAEALRKRDTPQLKVNVKTRSRNLGNDDYERW